MKLAELSAPFPAKDVEWRIQKKSNDKKKALVIAYHDARTFVHVEQPIGQPRFCGTNLGWRSPSDISLFGGR